MRAAEVVILFSALTVIIVISFHLAAGFALHQAVNAEVKYAVGNMAQLGYGLQGIVEGRSASVEAQFNYRYGALTYTTQPVTIAVASQAPNETIYANPKYGFIWYVVPYTVYGSTPILDKGRRLTYATAVEDAVAAYHYSQLGRTYVVVQAQPTILTHANPDGTSTVQVIIVEVAPTVGEGLLTRQGPLLFTYNSTSQAQYAYNGPVKVYVIFGAEPQVQLAVTGTQVYVYLNVVRVGF